MEGYRQQAGSSACSRKYVNTFSSHCATPNSQTFALQKHSGVRILQSQIKIKLRPLWVVILFWLELADTFQTFSELDEVKDKKEEIRLIRKLIDEDADTESDDEEVIC